MRSNAAARCRDTSACRPGDTGLRRAGPAGSVLMLAAMLVFGCSMAPRAQRPVEELPAEFAAATLEEAAAQHYWWHGFADPYLDQLVDTAVANNLDLRVAIARVDELQNRFRIARAGQLPSVALSGRRDEQNTPSNTGIGGQLSENISFPGAPEFPDRFKFTTYSASLGFAFELDFWGRASGTKRAVLREFFATRSDVRTALLGVIGETIAAYFAVVERQSTLALMRESVDILQERADVTSGRYERGLASSFEYYSVQQELDAARAELPLIESALEAARGRLALILGRYQAPFDTLVVSEAAHAFVLEDIPSGIPSDLLQERPDIVAAFQRLEAARERIGVARAARFPSFALTGAAGTQSSDLADIAKTGQNFWSLGAGITAPIFNAATMRANVRAAWAQYEQMAAQYEKTVLTAFREVEAALVHYGKEKERHDLLFASYEAALESARYQERRYVRGVGDYVGYLDGRRNLLRTGMALAASHRALAEARLAVHRSLGGAWIDESAEDFPTTP